MYVVNFRDFGWNILAGEFVIFSLSQNTYYQFNEVGKDIWELMYSYPRGITIEQIVAELSNHYDCDVEQLRLDVAFFIEELVNIGAVKKKLATL